MNSIASVLIKIVALVVVTFCFIVLYAHGTKDFVNNAKLEFEDLKAWLG